MTRDIRCLGVYREVSHSPGREEDDAVILTGGVPEGEFDNWVESAQEHPGSWWPHWHDWIKSQNSRKVDARPVGGAKGKTLGDAPGEYVKVRI